MPRSALFVTRAVRNVWDVLPDASLAVASDMVVDGQKQVHQACTYAAWPIYVTCVRSCFCFCWRETSLVSQLRYCVGLCLPIFTFPHR